MYHEVSPAQRADFAKYTVGKRDFIRQIRWLRASGYQTIMPADLLGEGAGCQLPPWPVIITFDDGFREAYEHAVPVLADTGFSAIFYVVTGVMGRNSDWLASRGITLPIMTWTQAREIESLGFRCGAHTITHPRLTDVSPETRDRELRGPRTVLEDHLGREVTDLAYPFGAVNQEVRDAAAAAGYRSACSVNIGLYKSADDPLMLPRVPVSGTESFADFVCRVKTASTAGAVIRRSVRALRALLPLPLGGARP
jgi:peptidoglycan/xylan/chitin deacetylase (PgdA/CDA1 family)